MGGGRALRAGERKRMSSWWERSEKYTREKGSRGLKFEV